MILLDTSGILAALDEDERLHAPVRQALEDEVGPGILSPFVLAEADYLLTRNLGQRFSFSFAKQVAAGSYTLASFDADDLGMALTVLERYTDLQIGLTDASLVVLADRYGTNRVLTLDERHFRPLRTLEGKPFTLLPADG